MMSSQWLPPEPKMPAGLIELMEGMTRDVLRHNPPNILEFCTRHMQRLLEIRDGRAPKIPLTLEDKIKRAQEKMRQKAVERRHKYDEAVKEHLEDVLSITDLKDLFNKSDSVAERNAKESVRAPLPVYQYLENDKEFEISRKSDTSKNDETTNDLKKSVEIFDEAVITEINIDTIEDLKPNDNYVESESINSESRLLENHIEIAEDDTVAQKNGVLTKNLQQITENNTASKLNNQKHNSDATEDVHTIKENFENHSIINTVDNFDSQVIHSEKVTDNNDPTKISHLGTENNAKADPKSSDTNSLEEYSVIKESIEIERYDNSVTSETTSNATIDVQKNNVITENNVKVEPNNPETNSLDSNQEINTGEKVYSDKVNEGSLDLVHRSSSYEEPIQFDLSTTKESEKEEIQTEEFQQITSDENITDTYKTAGVDKQLFHDHKNNENTSDTHEGNIMSDAEKLNFLVNYEQNNEIRTVDKNELETYDDTNMNNMLTISNMDIIIDPSNIVKQVSAGKKEKDNKQNLGANEISTEHNRLTDILKIDSKEMTVSPEITLAVTEANDNLSEVSEPKCEKKVITTLAVPVNNIINMNDGDIMHKTEIPDPSKGQSFIGNEKHNLLQNDMIPLHNYPLPVVKVTENESLLETDSGIKNKTINVKEKIEDKLKEFKTETDSTVENKIINGRESLEGSAEPNLPVEHNGDTQIIGLHIIEYACCDNNSQFNNSQLEGNIDMLDEESESDCILSNVDLDLINNQFDTTIITGESTITPTEKIIVKEADIDDGNKKDAENKIDEHTTQNNSTSNMDLETAAVTIQKHFRMFLFKSRDREGGTFDDGLNDDLNSTDEEADQKLVEYQISPSPNKERRGLYRMESILQTVNEEKSLSLSTDDSASSAATVIQAQVRGFLVRKRLDSYKTASISIPDNCSMSTEEQKEKKVLDIHIIPSGDFIRDQSILESIDLSLDGSPPSANRHPLGYDKNEPRKQLKREDAVQSVSPPTSNNDDKMTEEVENNTEKNCKDGVNNSDKISDEVNFDLTKNVFEPADQIELQKNDNISEVNSDKVDITQNTIESKDQIDRKDDCTYESAQDAGSCETTPSKSTTVETVIEIHKETQIEEVNHDESDIISRSSDESDVVTPLDETNSTDSDSASKLLHSGEFHDILLPSPTPISRSNTTVVRGE